MGKCDRRIIDFPMFGLVGDKRMSSFMERGDVLE